MRGSTECAGMGNERDDDDAERRARADVYSSARIGAAAALTIVLVVVLRLWRARAAGRGVVQPREVPPVTPIVLSTGAGRWWGRLGALSGAPSDAARRKFGHLS